MRLDRNLNADGGGKYALLKLRTMRTDMSPEIYAATKVLEDAGILDWGNTPDSEFFVIRLKDRYAAAALGAYASAIIVLDSPKPDREYASEIMDMARRSGPAHPNCQRPD